MRDGQRFVGEPQMLPPRPLGEPTRAERIAWGLRYLRARYGSRWEARVPSWDKDREPEAEPERLGQARPASTAVAGLYRLTFAQAQLAATLLSEALVDPEHQPDARVARDVLAAEPFGEVAANGMVTRLDGMTWGLVDG